MSKEYWVHFKSHLGLKVEADSASEAEEIAMGDIDDDYGINAQDLLENAYVYDVEEDDGEI